MNTTTTIAAASSTSARTIATAGATQPSHVPGPGPGPIVVALDGSYRTGEALGWAARLARRTGAELVAARVWNAGLGELRSGAREAAEHRVEAELREWASPSVTAGVTPRLAVVHGDTLDALAAFADGAAAFLFVVGVSDRGSALGLSHGSISSRVVHGFNRPVALVRTGAAGRELERVVLGLDMSQRAAAACTWTAQLAVRGHVAVTAVTAFEPLVEWVPTYDPRSVWHDLRTRLEGTMAAPLAEARATYRCETVESPDHVDALVRVAREHHAGGIVVGTRAHPGVLGHRRASTAMHLVHRTELPVIVVPSSLSAPPARPVATTG